MVHRCCSDYRMYSRGGKKNLEKRRNVAAVNIRIYRSGKTHGSPRTGWQVVRPELAPLPSPLRPPLPLFPSSPFPSRPSFLPLPLHLLSTSSSSSSSVAGARRSGKPIKTRQVHSLGPYSGSSASAASIRRVLSFLVPPLQRSFSSIFVSLDTQPPRTLRISYSSWLSCFVFSRSTFTPFSQSVRSIAVRFVRETLPHRHLFSHRFYDSVTKNETSKKNVCSMPLCESRSHSHSSCRESPTSILQLAVRLFRPLLSYPLSPSTLPRAPPRSFAPSVSPSRTVDL